VLKLDKYSKKGIFEYSLENSKTISCLKLFFPLLLVV